MQQKSSRLQHSVANNPCMHEKVSIHAGFRAPAYNGYLNSYPDLY
nr:MAG TPA: hypothetical protein [Caudoviricetes sp.]